MISEELTDREKDVVRALLAGYTCRSEIARRLTISQRTADSHINAIYAKTGAVNMADLVLMALGRKPCPVDFSDVR